MRSYESRAWHMPCRPALGWALIGRRVTLSFVGMHRTASLTLFAHVVNRPDMELDMAALLIGEWERPDIDIAHYTGILDEWASAAAKQVGSGPLGVIHALNGLLFEELGFHPNQDDYYDPRNSFLADVLDRRTGIPITLSIVYMEVARRMGVTVRGVSFPGHFLVRYEAGSEWFILDPFRKGILLGQDALTELLRRSVGEGAELAPELLEPATRARILIRVLSNLAGIYARQGDVLRSIEVLERMLIIEPTSHRLRRALEELQSQALALDGLDGLD